jgi:ParB-like nuclease domain
MPARGWAVSRTEHDEPGQWCEAYRWLASKTPIKQVALESLRGGNSPRLDSHSKAHVAQWHADVEVPPIIVHRSTMQIIDGARRAAAAQRQHQETIAARFFEGSQDAAFVLAVVSNDVTHGVPLSLRERKAAAKRILGMNPDWSDRMIAAIAGLTHPTIAHIRRTLPTGKAFQLTRRLSRDGKRRPAAPKDPGRGAHIRISTGGVAGVAPRTGLTEPSADAVCSVRGRGASTAPSAPTTRGVVSDPRMARAYVALQRMSADPALRNDTARALIQHLWQSLQLYTKVRALSASVPEHCRETLADTAAAIGDSWAHLARDLQQRSQRRTAATSLTKDGSGRRGSDE